MNPLMSCAIPSGFEKKNCKTHNYFFCVKLPKLFSCDFARAFLSSEFFPFLQLQLLFLNNCSSYQIFQIGGLYLLFQTHPKRILNDFSKRIFLTSFKTTILLLYNNNMKRNCVPMCFFWFF